MYSLIPRRFLLRCLHRILYSVFILLAGCFNPDEISTGLEENEKQTVRLLLVADPFSAAMERVKEDLEKTLGETVSIEIVVYNDMRKMALQNRRDLESRYDIISFDVVWLGEFVQKDVLLNIPDNSPIPRERFLQPALNTCVWENSLYGFPIQPHAELLWARKDLLEENRIPFPETTQEVLEVARQFHHPEQQSYGIAWNAQRGQPLGQSMAHFFAAFGQPLLNEEGQPAFNTEKGLMAARYVLRLMEVSPPDILSMAWDQRTNRFASGQVAMTYGWGARSYLVETDPASKVKGKVLYGAAPHAGGSDPVTPLGVWALGVPANHPNPERAWKILNALYTTDFQRNLVRNGNGSPPLIHLLDDQDLQNQFPVFHAMSDPVLQEQLDAGMRPPIPEWDGICEILGNEFHDMLLKKQSPEDALQRSVDRIQTLLKDQHSSVHE